MTLSPGTRLGVYEVAALIGEGGMGQVFRARDTKLRRDVALKVLPASLAGDEDRLMRFTREAQMLAALNHPNVAQIFGVEESGDATALVMEFVEGDDLAVRLRGGPMPLEEALPIAKQIAEALEAAHGQGIVHRDLKPANVKVRPDGVTKVLDFGLAKAIEPGTGSRESGADVMGNSPTITSPALTQRGVILGTAAYMSPEQARGKPADKRADIWAFGAVLFEMLTGRQAFAGAEMSDVLAAVLRQPVDLSLLPPETPPSVRRLLRRCLEKDRAERLADIGDARIEIKEAMAGPESQTTESGGMPRTDARRWKVAAVALGIASVILATVLVQRIGPSMDRDTGRADVVTFALVDDSDMQVFYGTQPFAISPDGRTVVFSGASGPRNGLWVRTLDRPEPRLLPLTAGGINAAISPDGQWVAFVVANQDIRKVRLSGGAPTVIASLDDRTAALAWESDDRILFEKIGSRSGIHRVSANGSQPEVAIPIEADEQMLRVPLVLRESRVVIYSSRVDVDRWVLSAFSLDDGRRRRLDVDGFRALGVIDDHLVYARNDGVVMAARFDPRSLQVTGEPRELEPRVAPSRFGPAVTLSQNGTLVSLPPGSSLSRLVLADADGRSVPLGEPRGFESPRLSPDGRRVAVGIAEGESVGLVGLWVLDRRSAEATRVTRGERRPFKLEGWTPDGTSLLYTQGDELWTAAVDGRAEPSKLVDHQVMGASLLPDGRSFIAVQAMRSNQNRLGIEELVQVSLATRDITPVFGSKGTGAILRPTDPRVSPDGRWVAFLERNESQVHIRAIDGSAGVQVSDANGAQPVWGHDSRRLFYHTSDGPMVAELQTGQTLAVLRRQRVPGLSSGGVIQDVSPDGKTLVVLAPVEATPKVQVTLNWAASVRAQLAARSPQP